MCRLIRYKNFHTDSNGKIESMHIKMGRPRVGRDVRVADCHRRVRVQMEIAAAAIPVLDILNNLPEVLERFTNTASNAFQKVFGITKALSEKEEELRTLHRTLQHNSRTAADKVREFIDCVNELYQYCNVSFEQDKYTNQKMLSDVLDVISKCISQALEAYTEAKESLEIVQKDSANAVGKCKVLAREAKGKKNTTKAVGGSLAGGAIAAGTAGGIVASVIAGVVTAGIGTVVGLGLTAAGSFAAGAAVGTTTAVVTHVVACDFEELEKNFRSLSSDFELLYKDSSKMLELLERSNQGLSSLSRSVERAQNTPENEFLFKRTLTRLQEQCIKNAKRTEGCLKELEKAVATAD